MKEVFKAINKLSLFAKINMYIVLIFGAIAYFSFIVSFFTYLLG